MSDEKVLREDCLSIVCPYCRTKVKIMVQAEDIYDTMSMEEYENIISMNEQGADSEVGDE